MRWLEEVGFEGRDAIPPGVFELQREQVALFVNRLISTLAIQKEKGGHSGLVCASKSEGLLRQLQHLLLRFGVLSSLRHPDAARTEHLEWSLQIEDAELDRFVREIGVLSKKGLAGLGESRASSSKQGQGDIVWDEVVEIEFAGEKQVYDLTVPQTHNFVANDICVHNTAFCLNMAANSANRFGRVVLFCSLEMSAQQLAMRLLASEARVDVSRIRTGQLKEHEWRRLIQATATLAESSIFIDDTPALNAQTLLSRARRLKVDCGLDVIMVDYLQLMTSSGPGINSREQVISDISRTLKLIAKELSVPVIALEQLNRGVEGSADKRPMLSDLRECVTAQTLATLADGRKASVESLVGKTPLLMSLSREGQIVQARCDKVWKVGRRPIFQIQFSSGRSLRATDKHRLKAYKGWKRVCELQKGDLVASASKPSLDNQEIPQDIVWDRVLSIEAHGEDDVYDLTVPGPASWFSNGIVSHNSGAIEQDADIIAFVYRDEYYNDDSEHKGIAEIIIGKHRSGSTGAVKLRFFPEYTRFENLAHGEDDT